MSEPFDLAVIGGADVLAVSLRRKYLFLTERETHRFVRHYGTEARRMLGESRQRQDLGRAFGGDYSATSPRLKFRF